ANAGVIFGGGLFPGVRPLSCSARGRRVKASGVRIGPRGHAMDDLRLLSLFPTIKSDLGAFQIDGNDTEKTLTILTYVSYRLPAHIDVSRDTRRTFFSQAQRSAC
ncbi:MAG TPA: hypothetical protein VFV66_06050, partial [Nonomuraea sp.]|nr:hypothetical protein [Nonomuraea sp.]